MVIDHVTALRNRLIVMDWYDLALFAAHGAISI